MKDAKDSTADLHGGVHTPYSTGATKVGHQKRRHCNVGSVGPRDVGPVRRHRENFLERLKEKKGSKLDEEEQELFRQQVVSCAEFKAKEYPDLNRPGFRHGVGPCRPHLGECPPLETRREMPWAEVLREGRGHRQGRHHHAVQRPVRPQERHPLPDGRDPGQADGRTGRHADAGAQGPSLIKKRRDFVDAIKECSTLRTEELCGAPKTDQGTTKCRVEKEDPSNPNLFCASRPWPT